MMNDCEIDIIQNVCFFNMKQKKMQEQCIFQLLSLKNQCRATILFLHSGTRRQYAPTLIDRGTVLWQMQNAYTTEGICLFRQVNELRVKRLQRVNSHTFRIISGNKELYPLEILDLRDMESHEFEIFGKYLWDCAIRT